MPLGLLAESWGFPVGASLSCGSPVQSTDTAAKVAVNVVVKIAIVPIAAIIAIARKTRFIYFTCILCYVCIAHL